MKNFDEIEWFSAGVCSEINFDDFKDCQLVELTLNFLKQVKGTALELSENIYTDDKSYWLDDLGNERKTFYEMKPFLMKVDGLKDLLNDVEFEDIERNLMADEIGVKSLLDKLQDLSLETTLNEIDDILKHLTGESDVVSTIERFIKTFKNTSYWEHFTEAVSPLSYYDAVKKFKSEIAGDMYDIDDICVISSNLTIPFVSDCYFNEINVYDFINAYDARELLNDSKSYLNEQIENRSVVA